MKPRVTLQQIALSAGVSVATISYALRRHPKIPATTRERIEKLAAKMGYRPDPALQILTSHRWRGRRAAGMVLGYLAPRRREWTEFQRHCYEGARLRALSLGYQMEVFSPQDYPDARALSRVLDHRRIAGVVVRRFNEGALLDGLDWHLFPAVACGIGHYSPPIHRIMPHHASNLRVVWQKAMEAGLERIGVMMIPHCPVSELPEFYLGEALLCQHALPKRTRRIPFFSSAVLKRAEVRAWVAQHRPQVIIGCSDRIYEALVAAGISVPEEVAFVSLERLSFIQPKAQHEVSGLNLRPELMGSAAVDLLDIKVKRNERGPADVGQTVLVEALWIPGETLRANTAEVTARH